MGSISTPSPRRGEAGVRGSERSERPPPEDNRHRRTPSPNPLPAGERAHQTECLGVLLRRALEAGEQGGPAAVHAGFVAAPQLFGTVAIAFEIAMLEIDERLVALGGEANFDRGLEIGII